MANATDVAAQFGYSVAFFNSDPELKALLNKAVSGNWTPAQFVAKLQATKWFKTHGEAARQIQALKTSDPATYNQRLETAKAQVTSMAWTMGATTPRSQIISVASQALMFGWSEAQIKQALSVYVNAGKRGVFQGGAAAVQREVRDVMNAYGYNATDEQVGAWVKKIVQGATTVDVVRENLIQMTSSKFPALKERLVGGETLEDIAAPYRDSYSKILEVPAGQVSLNDSTIQRALAAKDDKGKPTTQTVWQYEQDLRRDPRWLKTQNAQDEMVGSTRKVLQDFGLVV